MCVCVCVCVLQYGQLTKGTLDIYCNNTRMPCSVRWPGGVPTLTKPTSSACSPSHKVASWSLQQLKMLQFIMLPRKSCQWIRAQRVGFVSSYPKGHRVDMACIVVCAKARNSREWFSTAVQQRGKLNQESKWEANEAKWTKMAVLLPVEHFDRRPYLLYKAIQFMSIMQHRSRRYCIGHLVRIQQYWF